MTHQNCIFAALYSTHTRASTCKKPSLRHSHFQFLNLSELNESHLCIQKRQLKKLHVEITCCILPSCTMNPSAGVPGGEETLSSFQLCYLKFSFSRPKLFNYRFSVVGGFKDAFSLLLFCLQTHFLHRLLAESSPPFVTIRPVF